MHPVAAPERTRMMVGRVSHRGIGIGAPPGENGGTIEDQIAPIAQMGMARKVDEGDEVRLVRRRAGRCACLRCYAGLGTCTRPAASHGNPQTRARAGQSTNRPWRS